MIKAVLVSILVVLLFVIAYLGYVVYLNFYSPTFGFSLNYKNEPINSNFSSETNQFYPNMRFPSSEVSYFIGAECTGEKQDNMLLAFRFLENKTNLRFNQEEESKAEITVRCAEQYQKGDLFVAGEGGPSSVVNATRFMIIYNGAILLLRSEDCGRGANYNVELHELLHVLGFGHSSDDRSVLYNVSNCNQIMPDDIIQELNRLYSYTSLPDLYFSGITAEKKGQYLNLNLSVKNQGLKDSGNFSVLFYTDYKEQEPLEMENIKPGEGRIMSIGNMKIPSSTKTLMLEINNSIELNSENNRADLTISD